MFKIGDLIVYGNAGVCRVVRIGAPEFSGADKSKTYYTLVPYYSDRSTLFIPCDNNRVVMRPIISKEEAGMLLDEVEDIGLIDVPDERHREDQYKDVMRSCDCRRFISMIKTIYQRKQKRLAEGKKVTANDEKYCQMAEEKLYGELAIVLNEERNIVRDCVFEKVERALAFN